MGKRLDRKVAIITGAGQGVGKVIARIFAAEGAKILVVDINEVKAREVAQDLHKEGAKSAFVKADVSKQADTETMAQMALEHFGRIDILCNNAGIYPWMRIDDMTETDWDRVQATDLKGTFLTVKACLPQMRRQNYGRIVLMSSIIGPINGFPGWSHYGAARAGSIGFMRSAAIEVAKHNITINAILPGDIRSEGLDYRDEQYIRNSGQSIPMGKIGEPEDVAYAMLFLASDEAKYITGQTLVVDGGQVLPESKFATS